VADFCAGRSRITPPLPWQTLSPPFSSARLRPESSLSSHAFTPSSVAPPSANRHTMTHRQINECIHSGHNDHNDHSKMWEIESQSWPFS